MINKLHLAMIELFSGDAKRIQHFCKVHSYAKIIAETENVDEKCLFTLEADFLVNIMEDGLSKEAALPHKNIHPESRVCLSCFIPFLKQCQVKIT